MKNISLRNRTGRDFLLLTFKSIYTSSFRNKSFLLDEITYFGRVHIPKFFNIYNDEHTNAYKEMYSVSLFLQQIELLWFSFGFLLSSSACPKTSETIISWFSLPSFVFLMWWHHYFQCICCQVPFFLSSDISYIGNSTFWNQNILGMLIVESYTTYYIELKIKLTVEVGSSFWGNNSKWEQVRWNPNKIISSWRLNFEFPIEWRLGNFFKDIWDIIGI